MVSAASCHTALSYTTLIADRLCIRCIFWILARALCADMRQKLSCVIAFDLTHSPEEIQECAAP